MHLTEYILLYSEADAAYKICKTFQRCYILHLLAIKVNSFRVERLTRLICGCYFGCNWTRTHNHLVHKLSSPSSLSSDFTPASSKELHDIQVNIESRFTLKRVRDIIRTYSQKHRTDQYSRHSSIIWPVSLNGWVFVYELIGCGFGFSCSHLNFRFHTCFEQVVTWHSRNYRE